MASFILILQLFPLLLTSIQAIEASAPVPKAGTAKLDLLIGIVRSGFTAAELGTKLISQEQFLTWIQNVTATIVTFYNLLGIFKKSS